MNGKIAMVTGANSGIGKATARGLARMGAHVVAVCRDPARGEAAVAEVRRETGGRIELMLCDLASQRSIRELAEDFRHAHGRLDVLVNNAGAIFGRRRITEDGHEVTFAVNHLASFLLTRELLDVLVRSAPARVVNVASEAHRSGHLDFDDLGPPRRYSAIRAYGTSKLANVCFTFELARRLEGTGVTVNCLHPGVVATNFGAAGSSLFRFAVKLIQPFLLDADEGAETTLHLASSPEVDGVTGTYFIRKKPAKPSREAADPAVAARLWAVSEALTRASAVAAA
jgi:NAD(P)-dependent dehydrogenase (short-subunit alcohol dehydrogenase family)